MYQNTSSRRMRMSSRPLVFRECISDSNKFQLGQEKSLDSLHAQLQSETEKMVRWKVTTEVALDQKEKQLDESHNTIRQLRSNLMEQQLSAEHLSQSLMREKTHREQVDSKVETTRHLCTALRQQQEELKNSVREFGIVKEHLSSVHEKYSTDILSLKTCFEELTISHEQIIKDLKGKASTEITSLRKENGCLNEELSTKRSVVEILQEDGKTQKEMAAMSEKTISILEKNLSDATAENKLLSEQLNETSLSLSDVKNELAKRSDDFEDKLLNLQISLAAEKDKLLKIQSEFEEAVGKIKYLKKSNDSLEGNKEELYQQLELINKKKGEIEQELFSTKDELDKFSCQAKLSEAVLRGQISYLEEKTCDLNSAVEAGKQEKETLITEHKMVLQNLQSELKCSEESFTKISKDLLEKELHIKNLNQLHDAQENKILLLKESLKEKENSITNLEIFKNDIQIKFDSANQKLFELELNLKDSQDKFQLEKNLVSELRETMEMVGIENKKQLVAFEEKEASYNIEKKTLLEELQRMEDKNKEVSESCSNSNEVLKALVEKIKLLEELLQSSSDENADLKMKTTELHEKTKEIVADQESSKEEISRLENAYDLQGKDLTKAREDLNLQISSTSSLQCQLSTLEADLKAKQGTLEEQEKELKSYESALANELKKSEKLKARIENLEEKLKDKVFDTTIFVELNEKIETLTIERNELKTKLDQSQLPGPDMNVMSSSPLKTPSPAQYLPYVRRQNVSNLHRSPLTDASNTPKYNENKIPRISPVCKITSASPISKFQSMDLDAKPPGNFKEQHPRKTVSFTSPPSYALNDSDSSDAFVLEIGSDVDDRFDFIRRPNYVRPGIPQANVYPTPRTPTSKVRSFTKQPSQKRVRLEKSSIKTYISPHEKEESKGKSPVRFLRPKEKSSAKRSSLEKVSFDSVFNFPDKPENGN